MPAHLIYDAKTHNPAPYTEFMQRVPSLHCPRP